MVDNVLEFALENEKNGKSVAIVTVTGVKGSSPASEGQMMAVLDDGTSVGTVGGGKSEYEIIQMSAMAINQGKRVIEFDIDHSNLGMVCGGSMRGFLTVLGKAERLVLFGGGHISQALSKIALIAGFAVTVVESRAEFEDQFSDKVNYLVCTANEYEKEIYLDENSYVVICTRGHKFDYEALMYAINQKNAYIGMIGSKTKIANVMSELKENGVSDEKMSKVYSPIGLDIASDKPSEIAVAIIAEIIKLKNNGSLNHKKDLM